MAAQIGVGRPKQASLVGPSIREAFRKLRPSWMMHNPVMLVVEIGSGLTTLDAVRYLVVGNGRAFDFVLQISVWLWLTVLFANFAEAMAEGRGQAQAAALRGTRTDTLANRLVDGNTSVVSATALRKGDRVVVSAGEVIPSDGTVVEGAAAVDESAITGESAPVIRASGTDMSAVTGGTRVISDRIVVEITANPGETFLDRMITLIENAVRQKTPNEIALAILLAGLTLIFLVVVITTEPMAVYSGKAVSLTILIALLVCLAPTTIGGLMSAIGIAGMNRLLQHNVLALSGRAIEAAGDVNSILLDKTGTLTVGNRMATEFLAVEGVEANTLAEAALLSSLADETPEGRSVVKLAGEQYQLKRDRGTMPGAEFQGFTAQTRMSGVDVDGRQIRKGAPDAVRSYLDAAKKPNGGRQLEDMVTAIGRQGGTPLVVADDTHGALGVIHLKDVVKPGIRQRLSDLKKAGIKTVMITGDNRVTAETIAREVGVDEFLAEATPEKKLEYIKREQSEGFLVAMVGDGTNDAPALAQADVAVAMNSGTQAAREAGNMVDLDSNPTKLLDIVEIGKQILITRGAMTTFSVANDVAKYFAIIPAMFVPIFPGLEALNIMHLTSPESAVLSAVIFNAIIIPLLIPLALRGVSYKPVSAATLLAKNLLLYGFGGLALPFVGIKLIDLAVTALHLVVLHG
ncbi:MAG: potassium-transporting ATPase subunit KdpB [Thermaerobacter sp.]|nr:potassium-transporting ATPase subunit KdpB [Thermaerobacter sp.]